MEKLLEEELVFAVAFSVFVPGAILLFVPCLQTTGILGSDFSLSGNDLLFTYHLMEVRVKACISNLAETDFYFVPKPS